MEAVNVKIEEEIRMTKQELFELYEAEKKAGKIDHVILWIHMPGGETEFIGNPEVAAKMKYVDKTYDDNLVHKNSDQIWIQNAVFCHPEESMTFGEAIECMKVGMKVSRAGWNGKNQYIELASNISYVNSACDTVNAEHQDIGNKAVAFIGTRGVQLGWLASQSDMLAEDWYVVDDQDSEND